MDNETPDKRALKGKETDALAAELLPLERRLLADGDRWARPISATRLTAWIQTLRAPDQEKPTESPTQDNKASEKIGVSTQQRIYSFTSHARTGDDDSMERLRSLTSGPHGRRNAFGALATITIVLVVALMAGLFFAFGRGFHGSPAGSPGGGSTMPTTHRATPTPGVAVPGAYPGPQAAHIVFAVTAHHIDQYSNPIGVDTSFKVGENFFVVITVKGLSATQPHTISVVWLLNGNRLPPLGGSVREVTSRTGSATMAFGMVYSHKGLGEVNIYWDPAMEPPNDDRALGQTVVFTVS